MEDRTLLATMLWTNASGGDWNVANNWVNSANSSDHHVPTSADEAEIDTSGITVTYNSGASLTVNSLTISSSQTTLSFSNGSLAIAAASTISGNLTMSGGTLSPAGSLTVSGSMTWTGGTINGGGSLTTQGTLALGSASALDTETLAATTLDNAGSTTLAVLNGNAGYGLNMTNGALFDNLPGASFTFQTDAYINSAGSPTSTFKNDGTLTKAGGTNTSPIYATFNQTGTGNLQVQSGTLQLLGSFGDFTGGTLSGGQYFVEGTLEFNNAAITTTAATITLDGPSSQIIDQNGNNALTNLADISAGGGFTIENGRDFTAGLGLSNAGNITVGTGSTLTGNVYQVGGRRMCSGLWTASTRRPRPPTRGLPWHSMASRIMPPFPTSRA